MGGNKKNSSKPRKVAWRTFVKAVCATRHKEDI